MTVRDPGDPAGLAAGHALGSLTPTEEAAYQDYLAGSDDAQSEAAALANAARVLDHDTLEVTPSPDLKRRLMARIATTPQHAPSETPAGGPQPAPHPVDARTPAERTARRRWYRRPVAVTLAAAAAAIVIFAGGITLGAAVRPAAPPQAAGSAGLARIITAPDAQRDTGAIVGGGKATLIWSADTGHAALVSDDMPPAPTGRTYQLWVMRGSQATPAGLMAGGHDPSWQILTAAMTPGDTVGVTLEPDGGSSHPTSKPLLTITP